MNVLILSLFIIIGAFMIIIITRVITLVITKVVINNYFSNY